MKVIVLYESVYGNTRAIARAMGDAEFEHFEIEVLAVSTIKWEQVAAAELLVVGSPTRRFRAGAATRKFLKSISGNGLKGKKVAAFDTRIVRQKIESKSLRLIAENGGYAAESIAKKLSKKGGALLVAPEGFLVADEKGPLLKGELQRALHWLQHIISSM